MGKNYLETARNYFNDAAAVIGLSALSSIYSYLGGVPTIFCAVAIPTAGALVAGHFFAKGQKALSEISLTPN